jgi:hypothetical protein
MSKNASRKLREQLPTMLIVGEGFAEVALLQHLRSLYVPRGAGLALTIDNARGKGAGHVVNTAIRKARVFAYDSVWVLLDTDTDFNDRVIQEARRKRVQIAACQPCLEAELLRVNGLWPTGLSAEIKNQFRGRFGADAHQTSIYPAHFGMGLLDSAQCKATPIGRLIDAMQAACLKK